MMKFFSSKFIFKNGCEKYIFKKNDGNDKKKFIRLFLKIAWNCFSKIRKNIWNINSNRNIDIYYSIYEILTTKVEERLRKSSTLKDNLKMSDLGEIVPESTVKKSNEMFT